MKTTILIILLKSSIFYHRSRVEALEGNGITIADPEKFPYIVAFMRKNKNPEENDDHFCGGSLITRNIVLTAAHCLEGESQSKIEVSVGSIDLEDGKRIKIEWYLTFKKWAKENGKSTSCDLGDNDIAAAKLIKCVDENIPLAKISEKSLLDFYRQEVETAGWGYTNTDISHRYLLTATLRVLSRGDCLDYLRKRGVKESAIGKANICTNAFPPIILGCGDSGGPLVYDNELIGINEAVCNFRVQDAPRHDMVNTHVGLVVYKEFIEGVKIREPKINCCTIC